jgi:hypothetical protein
VPPETHLALYRSLGFEPFALTTLRGNLRPLGPDDAGLFEIPPGFTPGRP